MKKYCKGDMYYADLNPCYGSEQGGTRPVIILENYLNNKRSPTVIVVPLTKASHNKPKMVTHIFIRKKFKLKYDSIALVEQIRTIDKDRIKDEFLGRINFKEFQKIIYAINKTVMKRRR